MLNTREAHETIYRVLDEVLVSSSVPPSAKGAVFAVIDELQSEPQRTNERRKAEEISLALHGLEAALRRSDEGAVQQTRDDLRSLASAWIDMRVRDLRPGKARKIGVNAKWSFASTVGAHQEPIAGAPMGRSVAQYASKSRDISAVNEKLVASCQSAVLR